MYKLIPETICVHPIHISRWRKRISYKSSNQEDIEEMLERFYNTNSELANNMARNSMQSFSSFNMETCTQRYLELFTNQRL